ncbi:TPA: M15 family metallopeptidase [Providencia alcalifaciens]
MSMVDKQNRFTGMLAKLIIFAQDKGYQLTCGEAFRTEAQAKLNAANGSGISNSLHTQRLAIDFNLFKDGKYLTATSDYKELGEYWESLGGSWGGRFKTRPDGNHFSLEHNGVR